VDDDDESVLMVTVGVMGVTECKAGRGANTHFAVGLIGLSRRMRSMA
jgi:hypothetical protein